MKHVRNITSKGQVTIPKDIRDALGLDLCGKVWFEVDDNGTVTLRKPDEEAERERAKQDWNARLKEVQKQFKEQDPFDGVSGLEYQRWIRPDRIDI